MAEAAHSLFSASAAPRWISCPGSVVLSEGKPDRVSEYAAWGSVAHSWADKCVQQDRQLAPNGEVVMQDGFAVEVDQEMADCVNKYLEHAAELAAGADMTWSEQRVNYSRWLEVEHDQAWGTLDFSAVWIEARELLILDLKTGKGVEVDAVENEQLMLYAGGKLLELDDLGIEVEHITLAISQPRISSAPAAWRLTRADLVAWLTGRARSGAASVRLAQQSGWKDDNSQEWEATFLTPGTKQCKFCRAKATCPALRAEVLQTSLGNCPDTMDEFEAMPAREIAPLSKDALSFCLAKVDLIEDWCSAVRAEAHRRLTAGEQVPGFKLVQGKRGSRAWADETLAEDVLRKQMRLPIEKAYNLKLITPPQAEKLHKAGDIGPRQWPKLQALITQADGKPAVAPVSDPRPAIIVQPVDEAFEAQADDIC